MSLTLTLERGGGEVSGSGTNIELDGTIADGAIESVEMYGDTQQTTYTGKNLVNAPETFTFNRNYLNFQQFSAGTYYVSCGNVTKGGANDPQIGDSTSHIAMTSNMLNQVLEFAGTALTVYSNGWSWGDSSVNSTVENLIITTSPISSIADYEPYVGGTASPNPDYPQEVKTVTGRQVVTISDGGNQSQDYEINLGKNLCNPSDIKSVFVYAGFNRAAYLVGDTSVIIPVLPNTDYTISTLSAQARYRGGFSDSIPVSGGGDVTVYNGFNKDSQLVSVTINSGDHKYLIVNATDLTNIQIEKGSTATTYASYFTPIELCKIGTYQDYIYKSGEDWYLHKETQKDIFNGSENWADASATTGYTRCYVGSGGTVAVPDGYCNEFISRGSGSHGAYEYMWAQQTTNTVYIQVESSRLGTASLANFKTWLGSHPAAVYRTLATPTDTQITNSALIAQLNALNAGDTYDGTTIITVASENLAGSLEVTASASIAKTYTEVEIGSPFTITDVEGKSSNTTLDGNVYVDWAYNKKQYSFDLFNLTPQDYADIRAFYDYQFNNSAFPTITVPELNIDKLPVYMEISSRNIINQCLLTDKLTIKFRETVQP